MLGKLLKYEFKASGRILLPIYGAVLLLGVISSLFFKIPAAELENFNFIKLIAVLFTVIYGFMVFAAVLFSVIIAIIRFKKNLFGSEGYLMNTLPAGTATNIWAKLICAIVYQIIGAAVAAISGFLFCIIIAGTSSLDMGELFELIGKVMSEYGVQVIGYSFEMMIFALSILVCANLMIYASISIGHTFNTHKVLKSVGAYVGFYIISQIINFTGMSVFSGWINKINDGFTPETFNIIIISLIIMELVYSAAYFIITNYFLKNKLNLQ